MAWLERIEGALARGWRALGLGANAALLVIMLGVSADAVLRYTLNRPVTGTLEGVELLLVFAVFAGLARTQAERGHIAVGLLTEHLTGRPRAALAALASVLALMLFVAVTWATGGMAVRSWQMGEYSPGLIAFPLFPSRFLVALGSFFLCLQLLVELACAVRDLVRPGA
jgi:TRAP-type mannitol/chloroaromatic compound transport system permease small subunit